MPIRRENLSRYLGGSPRSPQWLALIRACKAEAGYCCEGSPAYPACRAANHAPHPASGSRVELTVAHLDHQPENNARSNLRVWCQRCRNKYDGPTRQAERKARLVAARAAAAGHTPAEPPEPVIGWQELADTLLAPSGALASDDAGFLHAVRASSVTRLQPPSNPQKSAVFRGRRV